MKKNIHARLSEANGEAVNWSFEMIETFLTLRDLWPPELRCDKAKGFWWYVLILENRHYQQSESITAEELHKRAARFVEAESSYGDFGPCSLLNFLRDCWWENAE